MKEIIINENVYSVSDSFFNSAIMCFRNSECKPYLELSENAISYHGTNDEQTFNVTQYIASVLTDLIGGLLLDADLDHPELLDRWYKEICPIISGKVYFATSFLGPKKKEYSKATGILPEYLDTLLAFKKSMNEDESRK